MKLCLLFLAILGVSTAAALPSGKVPSRTTRSLSDDWADFLALVPTDEILTIAIKYLAEDSEVQAVVAYIQSDRFKNLVLTVDAVPEYREILDYLDNAGLDVYTWVNRLHSFLGLDELSRSSRSVSTRSTGGMAGMLAEMKAVLPIDEIKALHYQKLETSKDYAALFALMSSDEFLALCNRLRANQEYQYMLTQAKEAGLDMDAALDFVKTMFGFTRSIEKRSLATRSLSDDWADFYALVDTERLVEIVIQYLAEDSEFQACVAYVQSDDFKSLVAAVDAVPEYRAFLDYLQAGGLDVYTWVNRLHSWLGLDELSRSARSASTRITGGMTGFWADVKDCLDVDAIKALYYEKLETSEEFAAVVAYVSSEKALELYKQLRANEKYQYMYAQASAFGLDLDKALDVLKTMFGFTRSIEKRSLATRSLSDDWADFYALVDTERLVEIVIQYLAEDSEFQACVAYVQSDDFKSLVAAVDAVPEYRAFLDYLQAGGLDVYTWVNRLHSWLGLDELSRSSRSVSTRITGGMAGFWADIKDCLDVDAIKALYHEKLETSEEFAALVAYVSSEKALELLQQLRANEHYQYMYAQASAAGLDLDKAADFFRTMFGWNQ